MTEKKGMTDSEREVEARDREWLANTYMGGKEQEVTVRTLILGLFIGAILSLSNLYVGFKTGWGLGVTITAAIMAFAVFKAVRTTLPFLFKRDLTILENNSLQTMAAACADTSSAGLVSAIPALMMVSGITLAPWKLMLWIMTILLLGIFMAIPMKRQMINVENLRFPTGTATAEVLKGIHETGGEAIKKARALFGAMGLGLAVAWCRDGVIGFPEFLHGHVVKSWGTWQWKRLLPSIPATFIPSSWSILSMPLSRLTLSFEGSLIMVGAGAIMGIRVGISLLFAAFLGYGVLGPVLIQRGDIEHPAPQIRAAEGFGPSAELYSQHELYFPVTVKAGQTLALQIEQQGQSPRLLARTWQEARTYDSRSALENALNAATLGDGTPNPFAGVVTFEVDTAKNHLLAKTAGTLSGTTTLSSSPATVHPALGFAPGSAGRALRFPFSVPAGTSLAFTAGRADGPRGQIVARTISLTFENEARFEDERALLQALNGPTTPDGGANPLHGVVHFAMVRGHLTAELEHARQWDASLAVTPGSGDALFGFDSGQSRRQNYGGYRNMVHWLMWPGVAMMVTAGLLSFFYQWRTILRALSGLTGMFVRKKEEDKESGDPLAHVEVPGSWFGLGVLLVGAGAVILQISFFGIHWWMAILAVIMSFFLAIVSCRATGETDITPVGAMGKITQLMYGAIAPGNMVTNLMTANVTGGAATSSGDLLQALRCGYNVGASPRKQFAVMIVGAVFGSLICVPVYNILIPNPGVIGTARLPAPAAQVWAGVAMLLSHGITALPVSARWALLVGGIIGLVITIAEKKWPRSRTFLPSPTGMGIALVIPAFNSVSMFLGALIAWVVEKRSPKTAEDYTIPVASGIIAGESLMGIAVAILVAFKFL
jgi:uncharacterized oligopeptide transporter (OPT) family protein